eukprot:jgi/Pico_ML_1/50527/g9.t1
MGGYVSTCSQACFQVFVERELDHNMQDTSQRSLVLTTQSGLVTTTVALPATAADKMFTNMSSHPRIFGVTHKCRSAAKFCLMALYTVK